MCDFVSLDYVEEGFRKDDSEENHKIDARTTTQNQLVTEGTYSVPCPSMQELNRTAALEQA